MKAIELLNDYKNIDFMCSTDNLHNEIDEAIEELESLKCCQNCKHYSMFDGKIECKTCFAINHTNWEIRPISGALKIKGDNYDTNKM